MNARVRERQFMPRQWILGGENRICPFLLILIALYNVVDKLDEGILYNTFATGGFEARSLAEQFVIFKKSIAE